LARHAPWYGSDVELTPGQVLAELDAIRLQLETLSPDSPEREQLLQRRADLRQAAQATADATRNPKALRAELEHLESRLSQFESEKINVPAWQMSMSSGGRFSINDPAAHASKLNQAIDEANSMDRQTIEDRIDEIKKALAD
jgi:chromosome segregation ATPase